MDMIIQCNTYYRGEITGSGETKSLVAMAEKAKIIGGKVAAVTLYPESTIGQLADFNIKSCFFILAPFTLSTILYFNSKQELFCQRNSLFFFQIEKFVTEWNY
jgi:hypothetical protein